MSTPTPSSALLAAAVAAVQLGYHVFPVRPGGKTPALHGVDHCPHTGACRAGHHGWEQRATTDPDQVRAFWTGARFAGCNIGIACGPSNLLVLDLDTSKATRDPAESVGCTQRGAGGWCGGYATLARVCAQAGQPLPGDTLIVATPSGGYHLYYRQPPGVRLGNTRGDRGGLGPYLDTRGHGGYVLAPGSTTPTGTYRVIRDRPTLQLPGWLVQALSPKPATAISAAHVRPPTNLPAYVAAALHGEAERVATAPSGAHTGVLFTSAIALGQLVGAELLPLGTAETTLHTAATHMITGPCTCTEREITRTITNGLRRGITQPRTPHQRRPRHERSA